MSHRRVHASAKHCSRGCLLTSIRNEGRPVAAFDLNSGEGTLAQFLPEQVTTATVRDINGQMALFDRLIADEDTTKVVDLGHASFESFFSVAHQIGFVEEARRRAVAVAILFTVTPDQTSVDAYRICATNSSERHWRRYTTNCWDLRSIATNIRSPAADR